MDPFHIIFMYFWDNLKYLDQNQANQSTSSWQAVNLSVVDTHWKIQLPLQISRMKSKSLKGQFTKAST